MREISISREGDGPVCERCAVADGPLRRMKGLLGRAELPPGEGLLLKPASSIHTFFMRFPIDAVFLDRDLVVRRIVPRLKPARMAAALRSHAVLELAAGECERRGLATGDRLVAGEATAS
jgi:uncharacterized membrane protein (UPF0127 family)